MKAQLTIQTKYCSGVTQLAGCYFTPPLKVMNITEDKAAAKLDLMLMSASPGILEGDVYSMRIDVAAQSSLQLHTQAYQRLFAMKKGADLTMEVHIGDDAFFYYLPHPAVPHKESVYRAHNKIYLSNNSQLLWGEVLTCGRGLHNEVFQFTLFHNLTEIFWNNKLVIKENLFLEPATSNPALMGQLEGFTHQATLLFWSQDKNEDECIALLDEFLAQQTELVYGITTASQAVEVRLLGYKSELLYDCLKAMAALLTVRLNTPALLC
jgi:urease accessory protein